MKINKVLESAITISGNIDRKFERKILAVLPRISPELSRLVMQSKINLVMAPTVVDRHPHLAGVRPRGWPPGMGWQHADGLYNSQRREVLVTQGVVDYSKGTLKESPRAVGVFLHELGHGIDTAMEKHSRSAEFVEAYLADFARIVHTPYEKRFSYLLQGFELNRSMSGAGLEEAFADVFAAVHGESANASETALLLYCFPRVANLLRRLSRRV